MQKSRRQSAARWLGRASLLSLFLLACGSRTGLFVDDSSVVPPDDGGVVSDARPDRRDVDVEVDGALPPIDAGEEHDADRRDCPDADATLVYVISESNDLYSFDPPTASFKAIGQIACPAPPNTTPFSMAVDRKGVAYVLFNDGHLYRVSTATAACIGTSFVVGQQGFDTFGMGYATNDIGPTETLFVAGSRDQGNPTAATGLAQINTTSFALSKIGNFFPIIDRAELTGTGDGRLFAFYTKANVVGSFIGEIDTGTAQVTAETPLPTVEQGQGWAFAFWGGDFYTFTAPTATTRVTRYRPSDNSVTVVANVGSLIVGAGVSTCAPQ